MQIVAKTNQYRQVAAAWIVFPAVGYCFKMEDAEQIQGVIRQLDVIRKAMIGKGESKLISTGGP